MKKKLIITITIITILIILAFYTIIKKSPKKVKYQESEINVITSLEDKLQNNTIWCGTFNLIWNDLKNNLAKQDIKFSKQTTTVENLNLGTFTEKNLNEESYYKVVKPTSIELKKEIEKNIKTKFNEKSDILNNMNWENSNGKDYTLYTMLKKEFEFPYTFDELENDKFKTTENIKYFGITHNSDPKLYNQVKVLYYENPDNFAIKLITKTDDEIILTKGSNKKTLKEVYEEIKEKADEFKEEKEFTSKDELKIPYINIKIKKEFTHLENQLFYFSNGEKYEIKEAIQTISLEINKKGGKIKSEAGMGIKNTSASQERHFVLNNTFIIFLKEKNKNLPYFGAKIEDITQFTKTEK